MLYLTLFIIALVDWVNECSEQKLFNQGMIHKIDRQCILSEFIFSASTQLHVKCDNWQ